MKLSYAIVAMVLALPGAAQAQIIIQDDFTQAAAQNNWVTYDGACLTAGNGSGSIPACVGLPYYTEALVGGTSGTLPDTPGNGALRFTNGRPGGYAQAGSIISNFTFDAGTGVSVIFNTVTYRGDSGGAGGDGADGMSFYLTDASSPYDTGAFGGSLGYTCSNVNNDGTLRADGTPRQFDGLRRAYLGLGIDEYGNFLNQGDNTASGYGYLPGRIGLRGAGSVAWYSLNHDAATSAYYPSSLTLAQRASAVQKTCRTGHIWDYTAAPTDTGISLPDYAPIPGAFKILPAGAPIANEAALKRSQAVPIAYRLKITQDGVLTFAYSYNGGAYKPVITKQDITAGNGPLPPVLRFGFAGSTGGSTNIHEILCFQAGPSDLAATSVGVNEKEAAKIASGTQAFLAFYDPNNWTGNLTANNLLFNAGTHQISLQTPANWDASCNLTGVVSPAVCANTGATSVTAQGSASRTMLTWNGAGVPLQWGSLSAAQQAALDLGDGTGQKRLAYLRGDRTNEINTLGVGLYRARDSVLGDIVDSSPTWVGPPNNPYTLVWKDRQYPAAPAPENGANPYTKFVTNEQTRTNVVYAGANDGLLHAFRAGSFDSSNTFVSTGNDGQEVLAYMPNAVLQAIHKYSLIDPTAAELDYSNTQYAHSFYVDATPAADDLYYAGAWHTWVAGGLGAGGNALYALDVTDPKNFSESSGAAASTVIGEWTPATITCVHVTNVVNCANSLGNTYGVPVIRRLHSGNWAVIFGNGYGSTTGDAGIFIMMVDSTSGAQSFYYLGTGVTGTAATCAPAAPPCNGIASPAPADLDGDHITDYVYAGDLLGNVWRFDLTNSDPTLWSVNPTPLFTDPSAHPITTKLTLVSTPMATGLPRVVVAFATGRKIPLTNAAPQTYIAGTHNLYGIWDWNMATWNSKSALQYASVSPGPASIGLAKLVQQTLTPVANTVLEDTNNPVCWADLPACAPTPQYGWYITLPGPSEQVVFNPLSYLNALFVNTIIPVDNKLLSCKKLTDTGNTIGISISTGGAIPGFYPYFADTKAVGNQTNASGSPFIVQAGGETQMLTQTIGNLPAGDTGPISCPPGSQLCSVPFKAKGPTGKRLTWIERR